MKGSQQLSRENKAREVICLVAFFVHFTIPGVAQYIIVVPPRCVGNDQCRRSMVPDVECLFSFYLVLFYMAVLEQGVGRKASSDCEYLLTVASSCGCLQFPTNLVLVVIMRCR